MSDRRSLKFNGCVAHDSLRGLVDAKHFTEGELHRVIYPSVTLWSGPDGAPDRELLYGAGFCVLDWDGGEDGQGFAFGYALRDDYVGYVPRTALAPMSDAPTHVVQVRQTNAHAAPDFKAVRDLFPLSLGVRVRVTGEDGRWLQIATDTGARYVPATHLRDIRSPEQDPVAVAERLLGAPYVWAGNSAQGLDCSGLVQAGCLACGIACPGDSDQQQVALGTLLEPDAPLRRGDLLFWKGHVAWVTDPETLLHANAFHMAVAYEPLHAAITRIDAQGDGPVVARKRLERPL